MAELALDVVERDALVGELDGVGVAQLVRREAPHTAFEATRRSWARAASLAQGRPRVGPSITHTEGALSGA
jgi:hypothetical protein